MFKVVPQNKHLRASLDGEVVRVLEDGTEVPVLESTVEVTFGKVTKAMDCLWVGRLAHYEIDLPILSRCLMFGIRFEKINQKLIKSVADVIPVFPQPIYAIPFHRIVPTHSRYAVDSTGDVFDLLENEVVEHYIPTNEKYYPTVNIYNPDRTLKCVALAHRLVALAWLENNDYVNRFQVNHIDGIKINCELENLEWVTQAENSHHAFKTGLREDNIPCKLRNAKTGEIKHFHSLSEVMRYLNADKIAEIARYLHIRTKHKLLKGEYELKREDDNTPWHYEKHAPGSKSGRYHLHIIHPNGDVEEIPDSRTFVRKYNVWNASGIDSIVEKAEKLFPGMKVTYTDYYQIGAVQAQNIATGEVIEAEGIRPLCRALEMKPSNFNKLRKAIQTGKHILPEGKWLVRYKTEEPWPKVEELERTVTRYEITAHNTETEETLTFPSLREAAVHFRVDRSLIKARVRKGTLWDGWTFKSTGFYDKLV